MARLLDLFCKAGGCSMGYHLAGFEVVGVDIEPQPNYPFTFICADALTFPLDGFDVIHASPPCQRYSFASYFHGSHVEHPDLIDTVRERLQASGKPYVIENVERSPVQNAIKLCGTMFGLQVYRHRLFESNILLFQPAHPRHTAKAAKPGAIAGPGEFWCVGGHFGQKDKAQRAMGINWMKTQSEIANAIPPAYTEFIGKQLMASTKVLTI